MGGHQACTRISPQSISHKATRSFTAAPRSRLTATADSHDNSGLSAARAVQLGRDHRALRHACVVRTPSQFCVLDRRPETCHAQCMRGTAHALLDVHNRMSIICSTCTATALHYTLARTAAHTDTNRKHALHSRHIRMTVGIYIYIYIYIYIFTYI